MAGQKPWKGPFKSKDYRNQLPLFQWFEDKEGLTEKISAVLPGVGKGAGFEEGGKVENQATKSLEGSQKNEFPGNKPRRRKD